MKLVTKIVIGACVSYIIFEAGEYSMKYKIEKTIASDEFKEMFIKKFKECLDGFMPEGS